MTAPSPGVMAPPSHAPHWVWCTEPPRPLAVPSGHVGTACPRSQRLQTQRAAQCQGQHSHPSLAPGEPGSGRPLRVELWGQSVQQGSAPQLGNKGDQNKQAPLSVPHACPSPAAPSWGKDTVSSHAHWLCEAGLPGVSACSSSLLSGSTGCSMCVAGRKAGSFPSTGRGLTAPATAGRTQSPFRPIGSWPALPSIRASDVACCQGPWPASAGPGAALCSWLRTHTGRFDGPVCMPGVVPLSCTHLPGVGSAPAQGRPGSRLHPLFVGVHRA